MDIFEYINTTPNEVLDIIENKDSYYFTYHHRKKSGKYRKINVPNAALKKVQNAILYKILYKFAAHPIAHGFVKGRSPKTNAALHIGAKALINIDLRDFFNTIKERQITKVLEKLLITSSISDVIINPPTDAIYIAELLTYRRVLIQGGPASPVVSNIFMYDFDSHLKELETKYASEKLVITRYADDISISFHGDIVPEYSEMKHISNEVIGVIRDFGLRVNFSKLKFYKNNTRMEVTGIVINEKLNVKKTDWRNFRACLHNLKTEGFLPSKKELQRLRGYAEWVKNLNPSRGRQFMKELDLISRLPMDISQTAKT